MALELVNKDPVSDKWRYYNTDTKLFELSDTDPTKAQVQQYVTENPETPPERWWGPIPGYAYPPEAPLPQDSAARQLENSPPPVVETTNEITEQEKQNLEATNTSNNPDAGEPIQQKIQTTADAEYAEDVSTRKATFVENVDTPNASSSSITLMAPEVGVTAKQIPSLVPLPNRLKDYPSYIYGLSLHILSKEQYNEVVEKQTYTPKNVLIASAGRYSSSFPRNEFFSDDFYFDDCNITTIVGLNDMSRNTNAVEIDFTIIEPYGFTLVERILRVADSLQSKNYLDMPYLLQIDFFAIDDAGNLLGSINDLKKRIPIKLMQMDMRITTKGTEYKIKAMPFNHSAYDSTSISTPANFEITASTVAEFFQSAADAEQFSQILEVQNSANQREQEENPAPTPVVSGANPVVSRINAAASAAGARGGRGAPQLVVPAAPSTPRNAGKNPPPTKKTYTSVKSYGSAINDWYRALRESNKTSTNDIYEFSFAVDPDTGKDEIGASTFVKQNLRTPKQTPMKNNQDILDQIIMKRADQSDSETGIYDSTKTIFQIQYGTSIAKLLEYVILNSDYIQNQLIVPEDPDYAAQKLKYETEPLRWFRIVPIVKLLDFDKRKKIWSRRITYTVQPYKIFNARLDVAPQGVAKNPVKSYNYIYTGKNDDVFDFDINFNALYYNQITAYRDSLAELDPSESSLSTNYQSQNFPNYQGGEAPKGIDYNAVMPMVVKPTVQNSKAQATGGFTTAKEIAGVDLNESLMTNSRADMLSVKLKILGDPDFIKQDDVFYQPNLLGKKIAVQPGSDYRLLPNNGSLVMDTGEVYAQLLFRTPVDIDESTGSMRYDPNYQHSVFSGLYKVIKVINHFSNGQFVQDLELIRLPRQIAYDYVSNTQNNKSTNRDESSLPKTPGVTPPSPTPEPSDLVSGNNVPASPADAADSGTDQTAGGDQPVSEISNSEPPVESQSQADLRNVKDTAATETINENNQSPATSDFGAKSATVTRLPSGVTQDRASGNYTYKGLVIPADPGTEQFNQYITAVDNKQTIQVTQIDGVSGVPITRTFDGNYTQAAVERAQNNVTFAEKELARLENKVRTDPEFQNLNAEQQKNLDIARARRVAEVAAAKSTLEQAKAGKYE